VSVSCDCAADHAVSEPIVVDEGSSVLALYIILPLLVLCCCGLAAAYAGCRLCRMLRRPTGLSKPTYIETLAVVALPVPEKEPATVPPSSMLSTSSHPAPTAITSRNTSLPLLDEMSMAPAMIKAETIM